MYVCVRALVHQAACVPHCSIGPHFLTEAAGQGKQRQLLHDDKEEEGDGDGEDADDDSAQKPWSLPQNFSAAMFHGQSLASKISMSVCTAGPHAAHPQHSTTTAIPHAATAQHSTAQLYR
eukprot:scaffold299154_cov23-Tisochrysis_lutea.AAC.1